MTDLAPSVLPAPSAMARLEPVVFAHARIAMLTVTADGVVVEGNAAAADLLGRPKSELVQEPIARHVAVLSGRGLTDCLREGAAASVAVSFGSCAVRRRGTDAVLMELVVSSGCRATGRELLLVQLAPLEWPLTAA